MTGHKGRSPQSLRSRRHVWCRAAHCLILAALACAATAVVAQPREIVEQPRISPLGVLSEVDSGLVTQVAQSNATAPVDNSSKPFDAADDNSGAIRGWAQ